MKQTQSHARLYIHALWLLPMLVLGGGLLATWLLWQQSQNTIRTDTQHAFDFRVQQARQEIESQLAGYAQILRAARGYYAGSDTVTRKEFDGYARSLELALHYPDIREFGFIAWDAANQRGALRHVQQMDGAAPAPPDYDAYHDAVRREALEFARTTGGIALSNKVLLPGEEARAAQAGMRMYLAVFREQAARSGVEKQLVGWIYLGFERQALQRSLKQGRERGVLFELYDGEDMLSGGPAPDHAADRVGGVAERFLYYRAERIVAGGYSWALVAQAGTDFWTNRHGLGVSQRILWLGGGISTLLALLALAVVFGQWRQMRIADRLLEQQGMLAASEAKFVTTLERTPLPIWLTDLAGCLQFSNQAARNVWPLPDGQPRQHARFSDLLPEQYARDWRETDRACREHGGVEEMDWVLPDSLAQEQVRHFKVLKVYLSDAEGQFSGILTIARDETEHYLRNQELAVARQAKESFLANMTHELRTPLNSIIGMSHLALSGADPIQQQRYFEKIQVAGHHMLELVDDVLDFSKLEADCLRVDRDTFELSQLLHQLEQMLAGSARDQGLTLRFEIADQVGGSLYGDPLRLRQILLNYLNNAIKFTEHGAVVLRVYRLADADKPRYRFEVSDTGIGISEEQKSALFLPFQQADDTITRRYGGSGLGLAICKRLAELMGGRVGVSSRVGEGSTFWLELPLLEVSTAATLAKRGVKLDVASVRAKLDGKRVLLAENNTFNQEITTELLKRIGLVAIIANNGLEALDLLQRETFDLVLMDVQMPLLDGLAATRRLRALGLTLPVWAMTANVTAENRQACLAAGMDGFISKPIMPELLYGNLLQCLVGERQDVVPTEAVATATEAPPLDLRQMRALLGGDTERVREFVGRFCADGRKNLADMRQAASENDLERMRALGHHAKSAAGFVGAQRFAQLCQQLQDCTAMGAALTALDALQAEAQHIESYAAGQVS